MKAETAAKTAAETVDEIGDEKQEPRISNKAMAKRPPVGLTLADVAVWSEIKAFGFLAVKETDLWDAFEIDGEREIGPADSIGELLAQVRDELADDTEITLEIDPATDAPFLSGMAPAVNKQLADAIVKQHEKKMLRVAATGEETKANQEMDIIGKIHEDLYQDDPSEPGTKIYTVGSITSRLVVTENKKFVTEAVKGDGKNEG